MIYKIHVNDRSYNSWEAFDTNKFIKVDIDINPIENKLFSNDVFTVDNNKVNLLHSSIRTGPSIPGVLILDGNKTYGREKKTIEGKTLKLKTSTSRMKISDRSAFNSGREAANRVNITSGLGGKKVSESMRLTA